MRGCFLEQPAIFFRDYVCAREKLDDRIQFAMDYEFWLRLARSNRKFLLLNRVIAGDRNYPERKMIVHLHRMYSEKNEIQQAYGFQNSMFQRSRQWVDHYVLGPQRRLRGLMFLLGLYAKPDSFAFDAKLSPIFLGIRNHFSLKSILEG